MPTHDDVQHTYPLTPLQEGLLIGQARAPDAPACVGQLDLVLEGTLDIAALRGAFAALVARHDALRTVFSFRSFGPPCQVVLRSRETPVEHLDLGAAPAPDEAAAQAAVEAFKARDRARGFDIGAGPLLRLALLRLAPDRHRLVLTYHRLVLDNGCLVPLFGDLFAAYAQLRADPRADPRADIVGREPVPCGPYLAWLGRQDRAQAHAHWSRALRDCTQEAGVPYFDLPHAGAVEVAEHRFSLGPPLSRALQALAREQGLGSEALFLAAWGVLLQKVNASRDVVFGTVVPGRPAALPGVERMVGPFVNTQPLRVRSDAQEPFIEVARRVQRDTAAAGAFAYYPLTAVQAASPLKDRLVNHVVSFEGMPLAQRLRALTPEGSAPRVANAHLCQAAGHDFHVVVHLGEEVRVSFVHDAARHAPAMVQGLGRSLLQLLQEILSMPQAAVGTLGICAPPEARRVLQDFNATQRDYPAQSGLVALFEQAAAAHAASVAVREGEQALDYAALRRAARRCALRLRALGVRPGDRVALLAPRGAALVAAMLGTLYCGAAYLPLDAHASAARLRVMVQDAGARVLCLHPDSAAQAPEGPALLRLDAALLHGGDAALDAAAEALEPAPASPQQVACVMATSGATGTPKGCMVTHRNVVRLVCGADCVELGPDQRILQTGAPSFGASAFEVWGALLHGAELCVVDEAVLLDAPLLRAALQRHRITGLWLSTALFHQLCEADPALFAGLRWLLVGGDVLSPRHAARVRAACPQLHLVNAYGPMENTTFSTAQPIERACAGRIPIGRPVPNTTAYVLDDQGALLPPGAWGELVVGGDGVTLGYLNRPELTRERFLFDPFGGSGGRLVRTGDIARWLPDGSLDLRGRSERQLKVRGLRIEPARIEAALAAHPAVREVVVVAHDGPGGQQLHAFWTGTAEVEPQALRAQLGALPPHMVPATFTRLERMPLTRNGKLDRAALPVAQSLAQRSRAAGAAVSAALAAGPRGVLEQRIAAICREVLGHGALGPHDDFFEAGADSLRLIALGQRLREALARDIPLALPFEHPGIARLAAVLAAEPAAAPAPRAVAL
ncbi:non-ribosomal peptide synthetase [Azohydromonas aeria]|uniref:non-ribosomal peptide synthetase n=1 Tax=Azohydromonas aeria TaxID=2590212 RepID=UPI0012F91656|nr:amino acid adenylation domain-containing protein [Azohydromonas aeria]